MLTILCIRFLCGNREYPASFQNKSVSSSFKCVLKYILFLAKLKGEGGPFWIGQPYLSFNITSHNIYLLHVAVMLTITSSYSYSASGNKEHPGNFQNKSVSSIFNWVSGYILFLAKLKEFFWRVQEGGPDCEITSKRTWLS